MKPKCVRGPPDPGVTDTRVDGALAACVDAAASPTSAGSATSATASTARATGARPRMSPGRADVDITSPPGYRCWDPKGSLQIPATVGRGVDVAVGTGRHVVDRRVGQARAQAATSWCGRRWPAGAVYIPRSVASASCPPWITSASEATSGRLPEMSCHDRPPFVGLEHVTDAAARDPAPRVAVEDGVRVRGIGRIDGHAGDVPVGQARGVDLVPRAAVVGGDAAGERRARVAAPADPGGVDDAAVAGRGQRRHGVAVAGVVDVLPRAGRCWCSSCSSRRG